MIKKILVSFIVVGVFSFTFVFLKNAKNDAFGSPPLGIKNNCGPEKRYKFNKVISSKEDFVAFLRSSYGAELDKGSNDKIRLDNFKETTEGEVDWKKVIASVETENSKGGMIYVLNYTPSGCQNFKVKMTSDGNLSNYGCCGK